MKIFAMLPVPADAGLRANPFGMRIESVVHSDFMADVVFGDLGSAFWIGRPFDCIFSVGFLREGRVGLGRLGPRPRIESTIFESPAI